eukprot:TRINITY_DN5827_c0_g1_i1.p1 TRINITY_DN5827_c0_g1~~TRINITY_DN5827_c0_g1_i1.p1  ORF type:complete len:270 (-),score=30.86 TRINITY_DN5827_c0_g1_i1:71-880(-)
MLKYSKICKQGNQILFNNKQFRLSQSKLSNCLGDVHRRTLVTEVVYGVGAVAVVALGVGVARAGGLFGANINQLVKVGIQYFKQNELEKALDVFDTILENHPDYAPRLWYRGITLYYLNRYEEAAKQFRLDVTVNPNDTEEAIWAFLCEAKYMGVQKARENFMVVENDSRPILRKAYEVFRDGGDAQEILALIKDQTGAKQEYFYGHLYAGLFHEANDNESESREAILQALKSTYAESFKDLMVQVAKIHCVQRGWDDEYMKWKANRDQ